jgi:peptide/nickel transport system substrate-binding protein
MAAPAIATILFAAPDSARAAQDATPATAAADHECVGAITWALETPPANLVPFGSLSIAQTWGHEHMYDSLLEWDRDLKIQPALAESWETPDDMTYVFHLRQDVKFHDGAGMTAADVKYSLEMAADPPEPGVQHGFVNIDSVDILDDFTVQVNMTKVDPTLPGVLAWRRYTPIVPEGIYDRLNVLSEGIGTGPFQLVEFVPDNRVVYTCFADYWKPGIPCVKDLTLTILPDEQSRVANLGAGSIDGASFTADVARTFEGNESISAINGLYAAPKVIHFNMTDTSKPWVDVRVRQAINLAVDRQVIIDNVYAGDAELTGPIPPGYGEWPIPEEDLRSTYYVTDVERAKELIAEAGYADGFEVTCQAASTPQDRSQIAQVIKEQLQQLNITVNVEPLEIGTFAENVGNGNFEWASTARGMRGDPSGFVVDFSSGNGLHDVMFGEGWSNDELDQLYDEALVTLDVEQRLKMYRRIQEIIISEEVANLYTVQDRKFHALNNRVEGMYVSYTGDNRGLREACVNDAE